MVPIRCRSTSSNKGYARALDPGEAWIDLQQQQQQHLSNKGYARALDPGEAWIDLQQQQQSLKSL